MTNKIFGDNVFVYDGTTLIACGKSISVNSTRKELDTTCSGSGDVEQAVVGKAKYTWDIDIMWRQDGTSMEATENITSYDFITKYQNKTELTLVIKNSGTLAAGEESYTGVGFITNFKLQGTVDSVESFTASGFFNSFAVAKVAYS